MIIIEHHSVILRGRRRRRGRQGVENGTIAVKNVGRGTFT